MKTKTKVSGVRTELSWERFGTDWIRSQKSHLSSLVGAIAMRFSAFPLRTACKQMDFLIVWSSCISFYLETSEFSVCSLFINCWQLDFLFIIIDVACLKLVIHVPSMGHWNFEAGKWWIVNTVLWTTGFCASNHFWLRFLNSLASQILSPTLGICLNRYHCQCNNKVTGNGSFCFTWMMSF